MIRRPPRSRLIRYTTLLRSLFQEQGQILLLKLAQALEEVATVESMPKMEGKRMIMMLAPKKKK